MKDTEKNQPSELCFLDSKTLENTVAIQSFPDSGNDLLRKYIENITGVYTGSD